MSTSNPVLVYFGTSTVERAVANYFSVHGVSEAIRETLMAMESDEPEVFLELVCDFVENRTK